MFVPPIRLVHIFESHSGVVGGYARVFGGCSAGRVPLGGAQVALCRLHAEHTAESVR